MMNIQNKHSTTASQNGSPSKGRFANAPLRFTQLMELFEDGLKDIFWAEKALIKAIPKMAERVSSSELFDALQRHHTETEGHIVRLDGVFDTIDKRSVAKKCDAMEGLLKEAENIMESCQTGAMCDAGLISAVQKIEHYEIATYGTLRQFAETLGLTKADSLLEATLNEEKAADQILSEVAISTVNIAAAQEKA